MSGRTGQSQLITYQIQQSIREALLEHGLESYHVETEESLPGYLEPDFSSFPIRVDLVVYKQMDQTPSGLDSIENIDRWFPTDSIDVPVAIIEVKPRFGMDDITDPQFKFQNLGIWEYIEKLETTLAVLVNHDPYTDDGVEVGLTSRRGNLVFQLFSDAEDDEARETLSEYIIEHIQDTDEEDLIEDYSLEDLSERFDPEVYHFNEVLHAYQHDRRKVLIILLAVFFESYVTEKLSRRFAELKENPHAGKFFDDWTFEQYLLGCRYFGLLEESEFETINQIRIARNRYAHNLEKYQGPETNIEQIGGLDRAVQLYEKLIGVKRSMTDDFDGQNERRTLG